MCITNQNRQHCEINRSISNKVCFAIKYFRLLELNKKKWGKLLSKWNSVVHSELLTCLTLSLSKCDVHADYGRSQTTMVSCLLLFLAFLIKPVFLWYLLLSLYVQDHQLNRCCFLLKFLLSSLYPVSFKKAKPSFLFVYPKCSPATFWLLVFIIYLILILLLTSSFISMFRPWYYQH